MKYFGVSCLLVLALLTAQSSYASSLLEKNMGFYVRDMEFYYQNPHPEVLAALLHSFDSNKVLDQGEKRLMLAAFLAETISTSSVARAKLFAPQTVWSPHAQQCLAWAVYLSRNTDKQSLWRHLPAAQDKKLQAYMHKRPARLSKWNILAEPTVLQMYWGAFMATGSLDYLDPIIAAARQYGKLKSTGNQRAKGFAVCRMAAASLYEFAPRHATVRQRLEKHLQEARGAEAETLRTILRR